MKRDPVEREPGDRRRFAGMSLPFVPACEALSDASAEYGGGGGGHKIAAGAYIPKTAEQEFVNRVNRILGEQFTAAGPGHR